ncbi:MAG: hypothetical protein E6767_12840 [Dysgonomonas sp.]|nr:hypothetical protein [Dysgonomonas sp.]
MTKKISAIGERAAIGGYLPQFDEFAWFVYKNLIENQLEWIKIADPEAGKLDDIQYATSKEIHAYQIKWTIADKNISFQDFINLIPLLVNSWQKLQEDNPEKTVIPHLITNKSLSNQNVKISSTEYGEFSIFIKDVWCRLNENSHSKWNPVIEYIKTQTGLNDSDFRLFIEHFDFQFDYEPYPFSVKNIKAAKNEEDLIQLCRFLFEEVGGKERNVKFTRKQIVERMGWRDRFKTIFNHDLIINRETYQPIILTENLLDSKIDEFTGGYIFLEGSPGSGKSSLLTNWSRNRKERIIKYYAFDFQSPSSRYNFFERGETTSMFFDLVYQLKESGINYNQGILPYRELSFLKNAFFEQITFAHQEYLSKGEKTIIIVDGLDHVPREYKDTKQSFLKELLLPDEIPEGIYIILGSQSYDLESIRYEVRKEYKEGHRSIKISPLTKNEAFRYIDLNIKDLSPEQRQRLYEISQGHPLYLSYIVDIILQSDDFDLTADNLPLIEGDIDNYYSKIWESINNEDALVDLLGHISRINGALNPIFIREISDRNTLKSFSNKVKFLFDKSSTWSFFHNSFRQFLLNKTALNVLTNDYDNEMDISFHSSLADYYSKSSVEPGWKQNYHLFKANRFDDFISIANSENFTNQFLSYRPAGEIKQDAKLGIEIARRKKDIDLLLRYLFVLAEINRRLFDIDQASYVEDLLFIDKPFQAKSFLRTDCSLHCSIKQAFEAARLFIDYNDPTEARVLFNLAYPEYIKDNSIELSENLRDDEVRDALQEWVYSAPYFMDFNKILLLINNIKIPKGEKHFLGRRIDKFQLSLKIQLGYSLIELTKWVEFDNLINNEIQDKSALFQLIREAIIKCIDVEDKSLGKKYLSMLISIFDKATSTDITKIHISDLIFKVTNDIDAAYDWIKDIPLPIEINEKRFDYDGTLDVFYPIIKYNKIMNLSGNGLSITKAIPNAEKGSDEEYLVEFERNLCLITQILTNGLLQNNSENIEPLIIVLVRFYYKNISHRNKYYYKLSKVKSEYFNYLIYAVSVTTQENITKLCNILFSEFQNNSKHWNSSTIRDIIDYLSSFDCCSSDVLETKLSLLESDMLEELDIHGRIEQCVSQAKSWLQLGRKDKAEFWIKQSFKESIGIAYSDKDSHFDTAMEWLGHMNEFDPENAAVRIVWYISHLQHIKSVAEGGTFWRASEKLLDLTFKWNFSAGYDQLKWQLDKALINFNTAVSVFIENYIDLVITDSDFEDIIDFYSNIYLYIIEIANADLLTKILEKGILVLNKDQLMSCLSKLTTSININLIEEKRPFLLSEINDFCNRNGIDINNFCDSFEIPPKGKKYSNTDSSSDLLVLSGEKEALTRQQVIQCINSPDRILDLIRDENKSKSYFKWNKILDEALPYFNLEQIKELSKFKEQDGYFLMRLSTEALNKGAKDLAIEYINKSLNLSREAGWIRYIDGGSRIDGFDILKKIDSDAGSERAFDVFCHDIANTDYPQDFLRNLDEIVPIISKDNRVIDESIWGEVYSYVRRLMSNSSPLTDLPNLCKSDKPINGILVDLLIFLSTNPVHIIKNKAIILLAEMIDKGNKYASDKLHSSNLDLDTTIYIIQILYEMKSDRISDFKTKIYFIAQSPNYFIRMNFREILRSLAEPLPAYKQVEFPIAYKLEIPEYKKFNTTQELDPYYPYVNTNNPEDLVSPFSIQIDYLSDITGIPRSNLLYRFLFFMKKVSNEHEWTIEYEKELRAYLEDIGLKYSYPRPRALAARKAIMSLLSELIDAGIIDNSQSIRRFFISYDYSIHVFKPVVKPLFIQGLKEREFGGVEKKWTDRINESKRLESKIDKYQTKIVIGEYTEVKNLDWGTPTETYTMQISDNNTINVEGGYIFGSTFHILSRDYHKLKGISSQIIIVRDHRFDQFCIKSRWIALNPDLARFLGWIPDYSKLFAWKDKEGNLVVESIYWANGNTEMSPYNDSDVGEGWIVVITEEGLEQIRNVTGNLFIHKKLNRSKTEDSHEMKKQMIKIISL